MKTEADCRVILQMRHGAAISKPITGGLCCLTRASANKNYGRLNEFE